ncbi:MAG: zinc ribbon domain-containing protein [Chloroflexi bacterium]|nr:zinc ribbon domain-containing protein [Chloroflexota bacterium]
MAEEIRCPMCGKLNPAGAEVCQYCQAKLMPVNLTPAEGQKPDEDLDWLRDLKAFSPGQEPAKEAEDTPDWLNRLRQRDRVEEQLASMQPGSQTPEPTEPEAPLGAESWLAGAREDETNWLDMLRGEGEQSPAEPEAAEPFEPSLGEQDVSQRLSAFTDLEPEPSGAEKPFFGAEEETWEQQADSLLSAEEKPAEEAEEMPDWLASLASKSAEPVSAAEDEIPGWLNHGLDLPETEQAEASEQGDSGLPDWLDQTGSLSHAPEGEAGEEESILPDWLGELSKKESAPEPPEAEEAFSGGLAALLAGADLAEEAGEEEQPGSPQRAVEEQKEDWLKNLQAELAEMDEAELQASEPVPSGAEIPQGVEEEAQASPVFTETESEPEQPAGGEESAAPQPFIMEISEEEIEPSSSAALPFTGEDIPDWLGEDDFSAPEEGTEKAPAAAEEAELAPGEMPGWLKAMRPVEAVTPQKPHEEKEVRTESMGPLAGLQGILPAENLAVRYRKPPIYSTRLKANDKQREQAALLEETIASERQPQAVKRESARAPRGFVRLLLAALLTAVLVGMLIVAPGSTMGTVAVPAEAAQFHTALESVPDGATVLVAVDYAPGYAGEMRYAAAAVMRRLLEKSAKIALISTLSTGPVMGEDLLVQAASLPGVPLAAEAQSVNMGYLPGGITSLQQFAVRPQQSARYGLNSALDGQPVWSSSLLSGKDSLDDFDLLLVMTDSVDSGRAWVEQVEPALSGAPLLVVSSAQSAPMLAPYVQSGQVDGLISGVEGGMAYEQLSQISGGARAVRSAYQAGMFAAVVVLLLGMALGLLTTVFSRSNKRREA